MQMVELFDRSSAMAGTVSAKADGEAVQEVAASLADFTAKSQAELLALEGQVRQRHTRSGSAENRLKQRVQCLP